MPLNNPPKPPTKPVNAKREKIMELAMAQLKKTRAQMDPKVLGKIRSIIAGNPKIMKGLGISEMPVEAPKPTPPHESFKVMPPISAPKVEIPKESIKVEKPPEKMEKIDQAKNMEVMAKLMALKPSEIENIKAVLLKAKD